MRRTAIGLSIVGSFLLSFVFMAVVHVRAHDDDRDEDSRVRKGFRIAPVKLNLQGKNRELVGAGSYLVNAVGGCNDCHTAPPYTTDPYAFLGAPKQVNVACYLAGGQEFGPFVSRDITPWEQKVYLDLF